MKRLFIGTAGGLLLLFGGAKLTASFGSSPILHYPDPVLGIPFRQVFWIVGLLELVIGLICLFGKRLEWQAGLVGWLATSYLAYHVALWWIDPIAPCSCAGNLMDALHIPPPTASIAMKIILGYLLLGSYTTLFLLWSCRRQPEPSALPQGAFQGRGGPLGNRVPDLDL
jgi:hypothetical protein